MTRAETLAAFFELRPNTWIDGRVLANVCGAYAWRTRISDIRRAPFLMSIENRQRRVDREDGSVYTVSEYRYVPGVVKTIQAAGQGRLFQLSVLG